MNGTGNVSDRLAPLSAHLASIRQSGRDRYRHFFIALGARMESARAVERELDRLLARSFNALDYLRTDELGLSRIVGDLLDPGGLHGQGACFLERFGERIGPDLWPADRTVRYDDFDVGVARERTTDRGGRLDISVELRLRGHATACIAIENKPYAADAEAQVADYLAFLRRRYPGRFLLIYLSGHGGMPSERGLPADARKDGLAVMSYCPRAETGEYEEGLPVRLPFALTDWLRECRQICDAERLRWFLHEVETFCHKTFGGIVTTTNEQKEVRDFILASDDNVLTALAVVEAWPKTRNEVVRRFLEMLRTRIGNDLSSIEDLRTGSTFGGHAGPKNGVWAFRKAWSGTGSAVPLVSLRHESGANWWFVGVGLDAGSGDANVVDSLRERLRESLGDCAALRGTTDSPSWPWYRYLEERRDWRPLLARLHRESQEPGELAAFFSGQFVEAAKLAIPIIDEVLGTAE